jgi:hypothetical protein
VGQTPGEIRHDIEQIRTRMSATIDAIGYRIDVPARARYRFSHIVHDVGEALGTRPNGHDGGGAELLAAGQEKMTSLLQAAQSGVAGLAGAVEGRASDLGQTVQSGIASIKENVMDTMTRVGGTTRSDAASADQMQQQVHEGTQQMRDSAVSTWRRVGDWIARNNALAVGLGVLTAGIVAGFLVPRRTVKQASVASLAGEIRHRAVESGGKVLQKGQQIAEQTIRRG